jgi:hypothetical protein
MKVNRELIEKYHQGKCTPEESAMVENWLLDDDTDMEVFLPENLKKEQAKTEIWKDIASVLPSSHAQSHAASFSFSRFKQISFAAAASVIILLTASLYIFKQNKKDEIVTSVNSSLSENKEIDSSDYTISLGPESNARIDANTGLIDFCGTMLISPKKDINLSFNDNCTKTKNISGKMNFKKGETYIALNYRNRKDNELIVMDEKLLMGLPPIVKRQIMDQFNI